MASYKNDFTDGIRKEMSNKESSNKTKEDENWVFRLEKSMRTKCKNYKETNELEKRKDEPEIDKRKEELSSDWQCNVSNVRDRVNVLYNNKTLSDITFIVGKKSVVKSFYAHKFILSISSPVFEAWFNHDGWSMSNNKSNESEITLSDEEPEAFRNLLLFIYTDKVNVNATNVLDTLYTAKKYCVTYLEKACINYLETCLDPESAFFLLTKARMFNENELADNALEYIDVMPSTFDTDGFLETTEDIICEILKRDTLNMPEIDLYKSIIKWSKEECKRRQLNDTNENIRKILRKNIIYLIRFPLMRIEEFANEVASKNQKILTETEIINMFLYFSSNPKPSIEFSVIPRYKSVKIEHSICRFTDVKSRWGHLGSSDKIRFSVDRLIYLSGFGLYGSTHTSSEYICTIQLINTETALVVAENTTRFYCDGSKNVFKVIFNEPVQIEPNKQYTACATLKGHDTFYGINGRKNISYPLSKKESINFNFYYESACNNGTSVEDGQIPVIYFSLNKKRK